MADPVTIPFITSDTNYTLVVPLDQSVYQFAVRWNSRDGGAWYFDLLAEDNSIIALGLKITLGVNIGRQCPHQFFKDYMFTAIDTSGAEKEATYDDLGTRVILQFAKASDAFGGTT